MAAGRWPLHSASLAYAQLGVMFSGGGGYPGEPVFRGWSSLSSTVAAKPEARNHFLLMAFNQNDDAFLDIVVSLTTPAREAQGDMVFNPAFSATATSFDVHGATIGEEYFAPAHAAWIAGRFEFHSSVGISTIWLRTSAPEAQIGLDNFLFVPIPQSTGVVWALGGLALVGCALSGKRLSAKGVEG
jgi:hypothetical protein